MAVYLFGNNSIAANRSGEGSGQDTSVKFTSTKNGLLTNIVIYVAQTGNNVKAAVYSDSSGTPNSKLGETSIVSASSTGWLVLPMSSNINIYNGFTYWLAWMNNSEVAVQYAWETGSTNQRKTQNITYPTFPNTYSTTFTADQTWSIYAQGNELFLPKPKIVTNQSIHRSYYY